MLTVSVRGASVWGPGLPGWAEARPVLAGERPYAPAELTPPLPAFLSATERRRTGRVTRLALAAAADAMGAAGLAPAGVRTVFGSSNGDAATVSAILDALSRPDGTVSPTQFHNSVHNAPAGYWSIGNASAAPSISVGCFDSTFAAALLAAAAEVRAAAAPVLLVAYDAEMPPPLDQVRPTPAPFAAALVLAPGEGLARLALDYRPSPAETAPDDPALACLFHANPAARAVPLLQCLAAGRDAELAAAYLGGHLAIRGTALKSSTAVAGLMPHEGAMCLLDRVVSWDAGGILCTARSHLDPGNPLRRGGRLGIVCAAEYAMQAAAAHGTLTGGTRQAPGFAASLRGLRFGAARLDDPAFGTLHVSAVLEQAEEGGFVYALGVRAENGHDLLTGRAAIVLPRPPPPPEATHVPDVGRG